MNKEQMNKYAYEHMVKNNSDEAVKQLLFKDKEIERLNNIIKEAIEYINNFWKEKSYYESVENCLKFATMNDFEEEDLLNILRNERNKGG